AIGRTGSSLLSDEEIELQIGLRNRGEKIWYSSRAVVAHRVHEERLTRNWFRSRMAWQVVSEAMRVTPNFEAQYHISELKQVSESLDMPTFLSNLFLAKDADTFEKQLDLIVSLLSILLNSSRYQDSEIEEVFADRKRTNEYVYRPSCSISPVTEHLFFEAKP